MSDNRQLTAEEHMRVQVIREVLQEWGLPADDLPVEEAVVQFPTSDPDQRPWPWRFVVGQHWEVLIHPSDAVVLWHNAKRHTWSDPYGELVCERWAPAPGDRTGVDTRVYRKDLMPPIWQEIHLKTTPKQGES